ncbi:MAG: dihydrolipoyl dehydrogenase [Candidatus Marinimicrobia bacterium]|nr:dihydrolipoyl dehydrogenase [Candidatus Neomarinimicrobiota bacterium]MBL7023777.1 dihydrolipoyl dehydrogenase [Candidatus Neomarinimicrobiota bacterium]MBL7110102.1 dihydrolipoyl dehydrogenase [Candidatus Neomarinimicrobiota bacterium]
MNNYQIIIIGAGPGGYVAAIRASQLGKKVAVVESTHLGGVCLNWGCIPTKTLLKNAEVYEQVKNAKKFGVEVGDIEINWTKNIKRSRDVSKKLARGIGFLFKKNNIKWIQAQGKLIDENTIETIDSDGNVDQISADNIIIATGARPRWFAGMEPDGNKIITSKEALVLENQPNSIAVIGAGAIGVEFAHFFNTFGTKVTLIEALQNILPIEDEEISQELERIFKKRKINIHTNTMVRNIEKSDDGVIVHLKDGKIIETEKALISVGVQGNIENIGLEKVGIALENGWIKTDGYMKTNIENIYAIGDIAGPPWLAHIASTEGITAVEYLSGLNPNEMSYENTPGCTYCHPEVASVGLTEKQAVETGKEVRIGKFPFRALGKATAIGEQDGFVKVIYDAKSGKMLGCHIIGVGATDLIAEAGLAQKLGATDNDLLKTIHAHPTLSEAIMEATADAIGEAIHL